MSDLFVLVQEMELGKQRDHETDHAKYKAPADAQDVHEAQT